MKITINTPTRKRPLQLVRMWDSIYDTADDKDQLELVLYIDTDDLVSQHALRFLQDKHGQEKVRAIIGPRIVMSDMHNKIFEQSTGEITQFSGDDVIFRTQGWDTILRKAFDEVSDKILFCHGGDGFQTADFGTHGAMHRNCVSALGYLTPPWFSADFADTWLNDVFKMVGRHRSLPYLTEHIHPSAGKAPTDQTYQDNRMRTVRDQNDAKYYSQDMQVRRMQDAAKLLEFIKNYG